jgi:RNA polymerase sigma-70 factor (ECF subfamily)
VEQYQAYLPRVLNYIRLRVDTEALAQDLTALTFERALAHLSSLRDETAFGGWLFSIARNVVAGHYRTRRREVRLDDLETRPAPDASAESQIVQSEELQALRGALDRLSEREQEIIRLRFVAGLPHREIGKALKLRPGNVAVILYRALRKLRADMNAEDT